MAEVHPFHKGDRNSSPISLRPCYEAGHLRTASKWRALLTRGVSVVVYRG
jgi:hypothetical protein